MGVAGATSVLSDDITSRRGSSALTFAEGLIAISLDDRFLASVLLKTFGCRPGWRDGESPVEDIVIKGVKAPYEIRVNGSLIAEGLGAASVLGFVDARFEAHLRSLVSEDICTLHAFGVEVHDGAVVFVGMSGAGKTTFGLAAVMAGTQLLGDEFAYLNLVDGSYAHAEYPLCLKRGAREILGMGSVRSERCGWTVSEGVYMLSPWGVESEVVRARDVRTALSAPGGHMMMASCEEEAGGTAPAPRPLRALVFPQRLEDATDACLRRVSLAALPDLLMPSVAGVGPRAALFARIVSLISRYEVDVVSLEYFDALEGGRAIVDAFGDQKISDGADAGRTKGWGGCDGLEDCSWLRGRACGHRDGGDMPER